MRGPVARACCGRGEWGSGARGLPALRHEFPDRLQYHDYLPGELLPPAPKPLSLPFSNLLGASVMPAGPGSRSPLPRPGPASSVPRAREGVGFAESGSLALTVGRRPEVERAPLPQASISPLPRPLLEGVRRPQGSEPGQRERSDPHRTPRSFWTAPLTGGSGKSVSERGVRSEPIGTGFWGTRGDLTGWWSNPEAGFGGLGRGRL